MSQQAHERESAETSRGAAPATAASSVTAAGSCTLQLKAALRGRPLAEQEALLSPVQARQGPGADARNTKDAGGGQFTLAWLAATFSDAALIGDDLITWTAEFTTLQRTAETQRKMDPKSALEAALLAARLYIRRHQEGETNLVLDDLLTEALRRRGTAKAMQHAAEAMTYDYPDSADGQRPQGFTTWALSQDPGPFDVSKGLNCWESVLFGLHGGGMLSREGLRQLCQAGAAAEKRQTEKDKRTTDKDDKGDTPAAPRERLWSTEKRLLGSVKPTQWSRNLLDGVDLVPSPLPGDVLDIEDGHHVVLCVGMTIWGPEVLSLWGADTRNGGKLERTTLGNILGSVSGAKPSVEELSVEIIRPSYR